MHRSQTLDAALFNTARQHAFQSLKRTVSCKMTVDLATRIVGFGGGKINMTTLAEFGVGMAWATAAAGAA